MEHLCGREMIAYTREHENRTLAKQRGGRVLLEEGLLEEGEAHQHEQEACIHARDQTGLPTSAVQFELNSILITRDYDVKFSDPRDYDVKLDSDYTCKRLVSSCFIRD